ncbi:hypothetical protein SUGI_1071460 [Cryptomeria japonica]|nr:hypothetical protein SUGI_1071460 [Cryptomeria japonica]
MTTLFPKLDEDNFDNIIERLQFFCAASGAKVAPQKSIVIGWPEHPPNWMTNKGWGWAGPTKINRYLGIPFAISPSTKYLWEWIFKKVEKKHMKWKTHLFSLARRVQIVQKVLSSHAIYYSSTWLFSNYQINKPEKILRDFLWFDGQGKKKRHNVSREWCCTPRELGGLGLKDSKSQGIALATKWIHKAIYGNEPWKFLIRNNICLSKPRKGKGLSDMLMGDFNIKPFHYVIFSFL